MKRETKGILVEGDARIVETCTTTGPWPGEKPLITVRIGSLKFYWYSDEEEFLHHKGMVFHLRAFVYGDRLRKVKINGMRPCFVFNKSYRNRTLAQGKRIN